jgi:exopolysaccharide biosynthesis polyprenyl glycosylphosphotransferase
MAGEVRRRREGGIPKVYDIASPPSNDERETPDGPSVQAAASTEGSSPHGSSTRFNRRKTFLVATDAASIVLAVLITVVVVPVLPGVDDRAGDRPLAVGAMLAIATLLFLAQQRAYQSRCIALRRDEFSRVIKAVTFGAVLLIVLAYLFQFQIPDWLGPFVVIASLAVIIEREIARRIFRRLRRGRRIVRRAVVVGTNGHASSLSSMLTTSAELGYEIAGSVDTSEAAGGPESILAHVEKVVAGTSAGTVLIATSALDHLSTGHITRRLVDQGIHVELCIPLEDIDVTRLRLRPLGRFPVFYVEPVDRNGWRQYAKRFFDVVVATVALLLTLPVLVASAAAIKLDSKGPVIFRQRRVGRDGVQFEVLKLRTMSADAEHRLDEVRALNQSTGPTFKLRNDPRVTRIGRLLRKLSIDEIPQLWNVLKGEMSVVGPRPALPEEMSRWAPELHDRLRVRPGITGMWQVQGRSNAAEGEYVRLDLYYVDNWSLLIDLIIVAKTIPVVLSGRGAY